MEREGGVVCEEENKRMDGGVREWEGVKEDAGIEVPVSFYDVATPCWELSG